MSLSFYNTLTRSLEPFKPMVPGQVGLYTCGPTVYDFAHIGNFRAYLFEDLLSRYLRYAGYTVTHVMNLTDVDDKTIRAAREQNVPLKSYTAPYIDAFFMDLDTLNIRRAEHYPAATDHVPAMIELIEKLENKGYAYRSDDGSVYFNIAKFDGYGKLARIDPAGMRPGTRVAHDEYEKDSVADFALWKAWDEADGDVAWDSPWGRGRPGWHIECSAMSMGLLGEHFDIHCGGVDNMFPHHDDEIAQSEAATGKTFVNYWLHNAHLIVDGKKMSKSLGNFYTLRELLERGFSGREIRYVLMATHYRQTLNFSFDGLEAARSALVRIDAFTERLAEYPEADRTEEPTWVSEADAAFTAALDDDLNISGALAALYDLVRAGHRAMDEKKLSPGEAAAVRALMSRWDTVLGVLQPAKAVADPEVERLVEERQAARAAKNWEAADRLRDELAARGWAVKDTPSGAKLVKL